MRYSLALAGSVALVLGACADAATDHTRRPTHPAPHAAEMPLAAPATAPPAPASPAPGSSASLNRRLDELDERVQRLDELLTDR